MDNSEVLELIYLGKPVWSQEDGEEGVGKSGCRQSNQEVDGVITGVLLDIDKQYHRLKIPEVVKCTSNDPYGEREQSVSVLLMFDEY